MKIKRTVYKVGEFIDYLGNTRKFIIAAVSVTTEGKTEVDIFGEGDYGLNTYTCPKALAIGVSTCLPNDEFNEEIGLKIAVGKALKDRSHWIFTTDEGLINTGMVEGLLTQEIEYFKKNPGKYLKGYEEGKKKFEQAQTEANLEQAINENILSRAISYAKTLSPNRIESIIESIK